MNIQDVQHLATLARLDIPADEQEALLHDLEAMIAYVDQVSQVSIEGRDQTLGGVRNVMRDDVVTNTPGANTDVILKEVPEVEGGFVKVQKIL